MSYHYERPRVKRVSTGWVVTFRYRVAVASRCHRFHFSEWRSAVDYGFWLVKVFAMCPANTVAFLTALDVEAA